MLSRTAIGAAFCRRVGSKHCGHAQECTKIHPVAAASATSLLGCVTASLAPPSIAAAEDRQNLGGRHCARRVFVRPISKLNADGGGEVVGDRDGGTLNALEVSHGRSKSDCQIVSRGIAPPRRVFADTVQADPQLARRHPVEAGAAAALSSASADLAGKQHVARRAATSL